VRENNIYVENVGNNSITQLTTDGSRYLVNGTFDWSMKKSCSAATLALESDGKQIAYWQLNTEA